MPRQRKQPGLILMRPWNPHLIAKVLSDILSAKTGCEVKLTVCEPGTGTPIRDFFNG